MALRQSGRLDEAVSLSVPRVKPKLGIIFVPGAEGRRIGRNPASGRDAGLACVAVSMAEPPRHIGIRSALVAG